MIQTVQIKVSCKQILDQKNTNPSTSIENSLYSTIVNIANRLLEKIQRMQENKKKLTFFLKKIKFQRKTNFKEKKIALKLIEVLERIMIDNFSDNINPI